MTAASPNALPGAVLVIGCGLIGTSVGLALRAHDVDVLLDDWQVDNVEIAASRGAGRALDGTEPYLVLVAVPPRVAADVVADALDRWPNAFVTDVTSVKSGLVAEIDSLPGAERYAGGHPMAGSERSGPMSGSAQPSRDGRGLSHRASGRSRGRWTPSSTSPCTPVRSRSSSTRRATTAPSLWSRTSLRSCRP
ncbi:prephenate dehydrogenase/arogenate dehydrogenase family protein [Aeromicrobium sp. UC242_57]|uniref:prephenate dehydrogenase/arogenate dehydrogenase family protein n=1 Tax=Aeromicrobium sp. UC242_57 TaxID=3374624 RepID=UPI0037BC1921